MVSKDDVINTLKTCNDPELGLDVWTLGLIYEVTIKNKEVFIKMTFTTPYCPYGPAIVDEIKNKLKGNYGVNVDVEIVFDPPWQPNEELRELLGV